jgi:hypothetical protein
MEIIVYRSKLFPLFRWRVIERIGSWPYTVVLTDPDHRPFEIRDRWALSEKDAFAAAEHFVAYEKYRRAHPKPYVAPKWPKRKQV